MSTNHCVEMIGSTTVFERVQRGSCNLWAFVPRSRPASAIAFFTAAARLLHVQALELRAALVERAVQVQDVDLFQLVALAGGKVVEVMTGRHFHGARAERHVDQDGVGDDRHFAIHEGVLQLLAVQAGSVGSSGWTATAVSPSMVSGRVVATTSSAAPADASASITG